VKLMPNKEHLHPPIADAQFPFGFLATGLHVGVKENRSTDLAQGPKDLAVVISTTARTSSAATFTRNAFKAAPVQVSTNVLRETQGRANKLVLNSGCANAVTGIKGLEDAWSMAGATDEAFSTLSNVIRQAGDSKRSASALVMSTGVIGQLLPINKILEGIKAAAARMITAKSESSSSDVRPRSAYEDWERAARAFMTTDTFPKLRARTFTLPSFTISKSPATFRIAGMDKGAGMIHPNMGPPHATLLGLIVTDVPITPRSLQNALTYAIDRSFNSISVDGDMSTNDTVVAFANGAALSPEVEEIDEDKHPETFLAFRNELTSFAIDLAKLIVYDGEGATKFVTVSVKVRCLQYRFAHIMLKPHSP
jgi:glutamate N-acetyltransferase/amino-acid N-acetyltransferase